MKRRIFIAINLPEDVKKKLAGFREKWQSLPARWTKPDNIHITLVFLGYINDDELGKTCRIVKETASKHSSFLVNLNKICYGPPEKKKIFQSEETAIEENEVLIRSPRMVWAIGEKSSDFGALKDDLNNSLAISNIRFEREKRAFSPHITLARIRQFEWKRLEPEQRPIIDEDINLVFEADSVDIMESVLKRGGPEYSIIESAALSI